MKKLIKILFSAFFGKQTLSVPLSDDDEEEFNQPINQTVVKRNPNEIEFIWSLVGNIVEEHPFGEQKEIRKGTKHFSSGTKVYCFPVKWGDGYRKIKVIGRPKNKSRLIVVIINSAYVTNWRLDKVYSPHVKRLMIENHGWDDSDRARKEIEEMAQGLNNRDNKT